ncbi:hypothetical protein HJB89_07645 [Rhizobium sp. NZLR8]|jgi:hypothetical protein|nr:hypothetical protein [Rhizobium sp. NZLR8]
MTIAEQRSHRSLIPQKGNARAKPWRFGSGHQTLGQLQRLPLEQSAVDAVAAADQRLVVALFDDLALVEDQQR